MTKKSNAKKDTGVTGKVSSCKRGRPSAYEEEKALEILSRLAEGEMLIHICKDKELPSRSTVNDWVLNNTEGFTERYLIARGIGCDVMAEETFEIADDASNDWMENNDPDNPGYRLNGEHINRSRLRVDTRKWYISKIAAKVYGDRLNVDHGVQKDNPITALLSQINNSSLKPSQQDAAEDDEE